MMLRVLQLFDGHNGTAAAIYTKEKLLNNVVAAIPPDLNRDEWIAALPRALVAGFVKTDKDFQLKGTSSCSKRFTAFYVLAFGPNMESYLMLGRRKAIFSGLAPSGNG